MTRHGGHPAPIGSGTPECRLAGDLRVIAIYAIVLLFAIQAVNPFIWMLIGVSSKGSP